MKGEKSVFNYRALIVIPIIMLLLSIAVLVNNYSQTGEWFQRSIELKGGTLITINTAEPHNIDEIEQALSGFGQTRVRELRSFSGYSLSIEIEEKINTNDVLDTLTSLGIDTTDSSIQTIGSSLGESFWQQAQTGIIVAFILMGIIVFVIFRTAVPSFAVMVAALSDIIVTLTVMQIVGIEMSLASFAALLMLIGYSIDTNILLTTRVLRSTGNITDRIRSAFKTGITMTGTTIGVLIALVLTVTSGVLFQIASVLLIGLVVDIVNTWLQNATLIRMHAERRES
jgi:preprotein translocase subunit SecF